MSASESDGGRRDTRGDDHDSRKNRRVQRACDACRRKKVKCSSMTGEPCELCLSQKTPCTFVEQAKKRGPPKGYVESVETRLVRMERLLARIAPGSDFTPELGARIDKENFSLEQHRLSEPQGGPAASASSSASSSRIKTSMPASPVIRNADIQTRSPTGSMASKNPIQPWMHGEGSISPEVEEEGSDPEDPAFQELLEHISQATIGKGPENGKMDPNLVLGKASGMELFDYVRQYKYQDGEDNFTDNLKSSMREKYWKVPEWEHCPSSSPPPASLPANVWPKPDLEKTLINLFFASFNDLVPLLHRPTFERELASGLHKTSEDFSSLCLGVFAIGARFSEDPRVYMDDVSPEVRSYTRGHKYARSITSLSGIQSSSLHTMQTRVLIAHFLFTLGRGAACWSATGMALRDLLNVGFNRKTMLRRLPKIDAELYKRAFWILYSLDRITCCTMGRPIAVHDEDIDLDFPLSVDDEYWDNDFTQPAGKPSKVEGFIAQLRLLQIVGYVLRTIYVVNRSRIMLNLNNPDNQKLIVMELDSALNTFLDKIPAHLRWNTTGSNDLFFQQSVLLYSCFYMTQIIVHRPFIPTLKRPNRIGFPSLAICTNSARSLIHVLAKARSTSSWTILEEKILTCAHLAGLTLLVNVWGGSRTGSVGDQSMALRDIEEVLALFKEAEKRHLIAGTMYDVLLELSSQADVSLPVAHDVSAALKRGRESSSTPGDPHSTPGSLPPDVSASDRRATAAARRTSGAARGRRTTANSANPSRPGSIHEGSSAAAGGLYASGGGNPSSSSLGGVSSQADGARGVPSASSSPHTAGFPPADSNMYGIAAAYPQAPYDFGGSMDASGQGYMPSAYDFVAQQDAHQSSAAYPIPSSSASTSPTHPGLPPNCADLSAAFPFNDALDEASQRASLYQLMQNNGASGSSGLQGFPPHPSHPQSYPHAPSSSSASAYNTGPQSSSPFPVAPPATHRSQAAVDARSANREQQLHHQIQQVMYGVQPDQPGGVGAGGQSMPAPFSSSGMPMFSPNLFADLRGDSNGFAAQNGGGGGGSAMEDLWDAVPTNFGLDEWTSFLSAQSPAPYLHPPHGPQS